MTAWNMKVLDGRPHFGWELDHVAETPKGVGASCDMCDAAIRWQHHIHHPSRPDETICVGFKCCEHLMTEEAKVRSKAAVKTWKARAKAYPEWFKQANWVKYTSRNGQDAYHYEKTQIIKCRNGSWFWNTKKHGSGYSPSGLDALHAAFDAIYGAAPKRTDAHNP